jgi:alpha-N-arabinofuranosidase
MEKAGRFMDGLSLHNYTVTCDWSHKGSATEFVETEWLLTMRKAGRMEELVQKHSKIMDEYDPEKKVGMIIDEWGTWFDVEPGTNPGFLYQQNTVRDALVAGIHFNIFNNHAERVHMANIAQTINVLQAVILTEGPNMLLTPTYHVYDMYKVHQDAVKLPVYVESETLHGIAAVSASASIDGDNKIHISLTNADPVKQQPVAVEMRGWNIGASTTVKGQIVTSDRMQDHNTFTKPDTVTLKDFSGAKISGSVVNAELPPRSVVTLELA